MGAPRTSSLSLLLLLWGTGQCLSPSSSLPELSRDCDLRNTASQEQTRDQPRSRDRQTSCVPWDPQVSCVHCRHVLLPMFARTDIGQNPKPHTSTCPAQEREWEDTSRCIRWKCGRGPNSIVSSGSVLVMRRTICLPTVALIKPLRGRVRDSLITRLCVCRGAREPENKNRPAEAGTKAASTSTSPQTKRRAERKPSDNFDYTRAG